MNTDYQDLKTKYDQLLLQNQLYEEFFKKLGHEITEMDQNVEAKEDTIGQTVNSSFMTQTAPGYFQLKAILKTTHEYISPYGLCYIDQNSKPQIVSAGIEGRVTISDLASEKSEELTEFAIKEAKKLGLTFSIGTELNYLLLISSSDGNIEIWDSKPNLKSLGCYSVHKGYVLSINYNPHVKGMMTTGVDQRLLIWNPLNLETLFSIPFKDKTPLCTCSLNDKKQIVVGLCSGEIITFNLQRNTKKYEMTQVDSIQGHSKHVVSLAYASTRGSLISASNDGFIKIWKTAGERLVCERKIYESEDCIRHVKVIEDRDLLMINCWTQWIKIWKLSSGEKLGEHEDDTFGQAWIGRSGELVTGLSFNGEIKVWQFP